MTFKNILLFALPVALMGCSHFTTPAAIQSRDTSYLTAKSIPPVRIPPGISTNEFHNYYPVADRNGFDSSKKVSIVPPGLMNN